MYDDKSVSFYADFATKGSSFQDGRVNAGTWSVGIQLNYELDSYVMFCKLIIFISGFPTKVIAQVNKKLKQNKIKKIRKPQNGKMYNYSIFILNAPLSAII